MALLEVDGPLTKEFEVGLFGTGHVMRHAYKSHAAIMSDSGATLVDGNVRLSLLGEGTSSFYLDIPSDVIKSLCLKPLKYLLFLGWCILGVEGVLSRDHAGDEISTDEPLHDREIYYYAGPEDAGTFSLMMSLLLCMHTEHLSA